MNRHTCTRRGAEPTLHLLARLASRLPDHTAPPPTARPARPWKGRFESNGKFVAFPVFRGDLPCQRTGRTTNPAGTDSEE